MPSVTRAAAAAIASCSQAARQPRFVRLAAVGGGLLSGVAVSGFTAPASSAAAQSAATNGSSTAAPAPTAAAGEPPSPAFVLTSAQTGVIGAVILGAAAWAAWRSRPGEYSNKPVDRVGGQNGEHYLIDAGSGWTRIEKFSVHSGDGHVHVDSSSRLKAGPLADALLGGIPAQRNWLNALAKELDIEIPVLIGGTAGVRNAVSTGELTHTDITRFCKLVKEVLGQRADFRIISGDDEAVAELASVRYCLAAMPAGTAGLTASQKSTAALLSSGGMSSQLVFGEPAVALSLPTKIKSGNALCLKHGIEQGLSEFDAHVANLLRLASQNSKVLGSHLEGTFVAIEMLGAAGERAGIGGRSVLVKHATAMLLESLADFVTAKAADSEEVKQKRTWKDVVRGTQAVVALRMLGLLSPDAHVIFARSFETPAGNKLKPGWTLGWYVQAIDQAAGGTDWRKC